MRQFAHLPSSSSPEAFGLLLSVADKHSVDCWAGPKTQASEGRTKGNRKKELPYCKITKNLTWQSVWKSLRTLRTHFASQGQTKKIRNFVESLSRVKIKSVNSKADFWISQNSNTVDYIFYTRVLINMLSSEGALIFDLCVNYDIDN